MQFHRLARCPLIAACRPAAIPSGQTSISEENSQERQDCGAQGSKIRDSNMEVRLLRRLQVKGSGTRT